MSNLDNAKLTRYVDVEERLQDIRKALESELTALRSSHTREILDALGAFQKELAFDWDQRQTELLEANSDEIERRRNAEIMLGRYRQYIEKIGLRGDFPTEAAVILLNTMNDHDLHKRTYTTNTNSNLTRYTAIVTLDGRRLYAWLEVEAFEEINEEVYKRSKYFLRDVLKGDKAVVFEVVAVLDGWHTPVGAEKSVENNSAKWSLCSC